MIDEIRVWEVALIREATMCPGAGLTVLTGETGAGKTALLSACKLLMGERADRSVVREGADAARVAGRFFLDGDACPPAGSHVATGESEVVVERRLSADGRSRVTVNGDMSSVKQLADLIAPTGDLCGQHEHQLLMRPSAHGALLDAWAREQTASARAAYDASYRRACVARAAWEQLQETQRTSASALEEARFALRQIDAVGADEGEYDELVAYLDKAEHAEALARAAHGACEALSGEGGALDALAEAAELLSEGARYDSDLDAHVQSLREAGYIVEDVARDVAAYRDAVDFDPDELARAQERLAAIQGLMRTFGPRLGDVLARRAEALEIVSAVDDADERRRAATAELDAAEEGLAVCARALHEARAERAAPFAAEVSATMARLQMGTAELLCEVEMLPRELWGASGPSRVEFLFRPTAGMQARPLARIASGGEMSRVMLAVHVVLGEADEVSTLVFDEVDAGVGGAVAVSLADVLVDLAKTHQVIAVTHLAQVAARADVHYVVEKSQGELPETSLHAVEGAAREREIARMLSGSVTEASLAHARELLGAAPQGLGDETATSS